MLEAHMISIGNDIIDLSAPGNIGVHLKPRYIQKILNSVELKLLNNNISDQTIWLMWSIKEASYKAGMKKGLPVGLYPKKIIVETLHSGREGIYAAVNTEIGVFYTRSIYEKNVIHTVSCNSKEYFDKIRLYAFMAKHDVSAENRTLLLQQLKIAENIDVKNASVEKNKLQIPFVSGLPNNQKIDISFSHDEKYGGYAYLIDKE